MVTSPRTRRVPKADAGNACAGPLVAPIQPSLRLQPGLLSGPPCVRGRATHPLAFLRSLEKSSQRPLLFVCQRLPCHHFFHRLFGPVFIESIPRRSALLALRISGILGPRETPSQSFTVITNFSNSDSSSNNHPSKVQSPHSNRVRENPDIGRSRHAKAAPRTMPMFVPQVAVLN